MLEKALGSVDNPSVEQISRIARNLGLSEAQVYNFINRNRPKKRRYSTSDILRPNRRFDFTANPFASASNNASSSHSDEASEGGVRSEGTPPPLLVCLAPVQLRRTCNSAYINDLFA